MGQRNTNILATFTGYHIAKTILWRFGYGATFFYRTRFMTIPILCYGLWHTTFRRYPADLKAANLLEYTQRKVRFEKDMHVV